MDPVTVFAVVLGLFLAGTGPILVLRSEVMVRAYEEMIENRKVLYAAAFIELVFGVIIVSIHNVWTWGYEGVVTVIGWLMIAEAIFHFVAPTDIEKQLVDVFSTYRGWEVCGVLFTVIGLYLLVAGLGFL